MARTGKAADNGQPRLQFAALQLQEAYRKEKEQVPNPAFACSVARYAISIEGSPTDRSLFGDLFRVATMRYTLDEDEAELELEGFTYKHAEETPEAAVVYFQQTRVGTADADRATTAFRKFFNTMTERIGEGTWRLPEPTPQDPWWPTIT